MCLHVFSLSLLPDPNQVGDRHVRIRDLHVGRCGLLRPTGLGVDQHVVLSICDAKALRPAAWIISVLFSEYPLHGRRKHCASIASTRPLLDAIGSCPAVRWRSPSQVSRWQRGLLKSFISPTEQRQAAIRPSTVQGEVNLTGLGKGLVCSLHQATRYSEMRFVSKAGSCHRMSPPNWFTSRS